MRIFTDTEVAAAIIEEKGRYGLWAGAGFSAEANIPTAQAISAKIRQELFEQRSDTESSEDEEAWAERNLDWRDPGERYLTCLAKRYKNEARRVGFFRRILLDKKPSLAHYAASLLISNHYFSSNCLTTNFDHLLENAFAHQDLSGWQAIRTDEEVTYVETLSGRFFIVKLHGDVDTQNIRNTRRETLELSRPMTGLVSSIAKSIGLVVIGTAGNEKSVWKLFEGLSGGAGAAPWPMGLFWGVYMGQERPVNLSNKQLRDLVRQRIVETEINRFIVDLMEDSSNEYFGFFPVWGTGRFLFDVLRRTGDKQLVGAATRYLDHEIRLRHVFRESGLTDEAVVQHLKSLRKERNRIESGSVRVKALHEPLLEIKGPFGCQVHIQYGDITSRSMMSSSQYQETRRAVVSPEDTCVSAGGGVAYSLLKKAGTRVILNELAKFSPIPHRSVAVTSAGNLPVHYIIHAASLKIDPDASYCASIEDVHQTVGAILSTVDVLGIEVLWIPLLASGVAALGAEDSLRAILVAIRTWAETLQVEVPVHLVLMIYRENVLPRHRVRLVTDETLKRWLISA